MPIKSAIFHWGKKMVKKNPWSVFVHKNLVTFRIVKHPYALSNNLVEFKGCCSSSTLPRLGESLVLVAAWSRQGGTAGGFFWISSLKQVERWAGAGSEAWPFFLDVRLSFSAALQGEKYKIHMKSFFNHAQGSLIFNLWKFTWLKETWQQCWRCSPLWTKEGSWSWLAQQHRHRRGTGRHHLQAAQRESSL